jgi:phosphoribosyl 1,2-cyclic phosphate phosphodiesterase
MARSYLITILGSGTSTGVPILTCKCAVCRSGNPKNKRLRTSAWIQSGGKSILIDTGPDFRQQALRAKISRVDSVLYTHPHADHLNGLDDLRAYNFTQKEDMNVYGNAWLTQELHERFAYAFGGKPEGGILPSLKAHTLETDATGGYKPIKLHGIPILPIALPHGSKETVGYRIGRDDDGVAYVTDCSYIPTSSLEKLKGLDVLILDCVRLEPHKTHLHLSKSLEIVAELEPRKTFLTHLGHDFDYAKWSRKLPRGVAMAYDCLKIKV